LNPGVAILAQASSSHAQHREGYDISLPLFLPEHPLRGENIENSEDQTQRSNSFSSNKKALLVFKGKRYT
jgi:hypothetical protein